MNIYVYIPNPFTKKTFQDLWSFTKSISKHKALELQLYQDDEALFMFDFLIRLKQDHEGFQLSLNLLTLVFCFHFYDTRHLEELMKKSA